MTWQYFTTWGSFLKYDNISRLCTVPFPNEALSLLIGSNHKRAVMIYQRLDYLLNYQVMSNLPLTMTMAYQMWRKGKSGNFSRRPYKQTMGTKCYIRRGRPFTLSWVDYVNFFSLQGHQQVQGLFWVGQLTFSSSCGAFACEVHVH